MNVEMNEKASSVDMVKFNEKAKQVSITEMLSEVLEQSEKVHIPDTFEDSDADNESLSDKLRRIDAYNETGQGSKQAMGKDESGHQIWHMEVNK